VGEATAEMFLSADPPRLDRAKEIPAGRERTGTGGSVVRTKHGEEASVELVVADSGPGIPPQQVPHLFESFFTTKKTGMGLGLSIARSTAEAHGGRIKLCWHEPTERDRAVRMLDCPGRPWYVRPVPPNILARLSTRNRCWRRP
jgi:hypothetical protein